MQKKNTAFLILSIFITSNTFASEDIKIVDAYFKQHKGGKAPQENRNFLRDECFIKANEFIYNPQKQRDVVISQGDPHLKTEQNKVTVKYPDYESALGALYVCVNQSENPIAAWEGLHIINTFTTGALASKKINEYTKFSKVLYEDQSCDGYIHYGDVFGKGIGIKPDHSRALTIYEQGLEVCSEGWYKTVLQMRINNMKKQIK